MKTIYKLTAFAVALIIAAAGLIPAAAYTDKSDFYKEKIIEYNLVKASANSVQEWIDGGLTLDAGEGSEWYIIALSNLGKYDFSKYKTALNSFLSKNETGSASSRLKYALTFVAIGDTSNPHITEFIDNSTGEQGIMSLIFGLHLLNNGYECSNYSENKLINEILSLQLADGGFSVSGEYGDVDVTAMTVQSLAPHRNKSSVKSAVDCALEFLSARQLESGGYKSYGAENPESSAQVVIALSALGIDVCNNERFIKNGNTVFDGIEKFLLDDGSFCHKENGNSDSTATAQVLGACVAYDMMKNGKPSFYIFHKTVHEEPTAIHSETETTEETVLTEILSETASPTFTEPETSKESLAQKSETKPDLFISIIIAVCVVAILTCIVLFIIGKRKLSAVVIVTAIAVIIVFAGISQREAETVGCVTISINCHLIKDEGKKHIPENGVILEESEFEIKSGDTVYDVLAEACKENDILFSSNMGYIEGINNVFEMDFGKSSGWIYFVNGEAPSVGCNNYVLADGDRIEWHYTRETGKDLDINFEKEYN